MHGLVARDHDARADVADDTGEEDERVDDGDRYHDVQGVPVLTKGLMLLQGGSRASVVQERRDHRDRSRARARDPLVPVLRS